MSRSAFYDYTGPTRDVTVEGRRFRVPLFYHDNDVFTSVHTASYERVAAALPSELLRPARWSDGRALLAVSAFRYHAVTTCDAEVQTLAPYGEISIAAMVTVGESPRVMPLFRSPLRGFVLHLPVTTREARDAGRIVNGFPKFMADMHFVEEPGCRQVELAEGGQPILTLTVHPTGPIVPDHRPQVAYTCLNGELLDTMVHVQGHMQVRLGKGSGELRLGDHQVARQLHGLEVSDTPVCTFSYLDHRSILAPSQIVGPARTYLGYLGATRDFAQFTVSYPHATRFDQYAALAVAQVAP